MIDFWKWRRLKKPYKFTYSVFLFDLLSFILTHLSYLLSISYILYSKFKSNPCFRNLLLYTNLWQTLTPTEVAWFYFFACFFCCASGLVEHMGTVGICLNQLFQKKKIRRKLCIVIVLPLFMTLITLKLLVPTSVRPNVFHILGGIKLLKILNVNTDVQKQSKNLSYLAANLILGALLWWKYPPNY